MEIERRSIQFMIRLKPSEELYIRREANERGQRPSEYARNMILANAVLTVNNNVDKRIANK